jgi:hypothetical protein
VEASNLQAIVGWSLCAAALAAACVDKHAAVILKNFSFEMTIKHVDTEVRVDNQSDVVKQKNPGCKHVS